MRTKRRHEGYLQIDHRASPGTALIPEGANFESATVTCAHCHQVVVLNPMRTRERGHCRKCDAYVCDKPACNSECRPMEKTIDRLQERAFRQLSKSPGGIILPDPNIN